MAVTVTFRVETRPWRGYDDPSLPAGSWFAEGSAPGDGTGGALTVDLLFKFSGQALNGNLFNLEAMSIFAIPGTVTSCVVSTARLDFLSPSRPAAGKLFVVPLLLGLTGAGSASGLQELNSPVFLGAAVEAANTAALRFQTDNGVGSLLNINAGGYFWEPRSLLAPGGLNRPPNGLYGG